MLELPASARLCKCLRCSIATGVTQHVAFCLSWVCVCEFSLLGAIFGVVFTGRSKGQPKVSTAMSTPQTRRAPLGGPFPFPC